MLMPPSGNSKSLAKFITNKRKKDCILQSFLHPFIPNYAFQPFPSRKSMMWFQSWRLR